MQRLHGKQLALLRWLAGVSDEQPVYCSRNNNPLSKTSDGLFAALCRLERRGFIVGPFNRVTELGHKVVQH